MSPSYMPWANDLDPQSESSDWLHGYCYKWGLTVNEDNAKRVVFRDPEKKEYIQQIHFIRMVTVIRKKYYAECLLSHYRVTGKPIRTRHFHRF